VTTGPFEEPSDADEGDHTTQTASQTDDVAGDGDVAESPEMLEPDPTGEPRVDAAVQELVLLDELPTSEHADVYEDVHRRLHAALTELDTE
jgi:hypothetical protein